MRRMRKLLIPAAAALLLHPNPTAQTTEPPTVTILKPARVFDGEAMHEGWAVRVRGNRIEAVGADAAAGAPGARVVDLTGMTLTPGLVEGHSHVLLHPPVRYASIPISSITSNTLRIERIDFAYAKLGEYPFSTIT